MKIAIVTGNTGIGKTCVLKPITEKDETSQYVDLIANDSPDIVVGKKIVVVDHADGESGVVDKLIDEASAHDVEAVLLVGQDLRDFNLVNRSWNIDMSIEFIGRFSDMRLRVTHGDQQSVYSKCDISNIGQLVN